MRSIWNWWASVPGWARQTFLVAAIAVAAWTLRTGIPWMIRSIYILVLEKLEKTEREIREAAYRKGVINLTIPAEEIIKQSRLWPWLVERAKRWNERRKKYKK